MKHFSLIFQLTLLLISINLSTSTTWNEESLFNYTEINFLHSNILNNSFQYLIIDPESLIESGHLATIKQNLHSLNKDHNIINMFFTVKAVEQNFNSENFEKLIKKIHDRIISNNIPFNFKLLLCILISTNEPKIFIVRGNEIKKVIKEEELDSLIEKLDKEILNENKISHIAVNYYENILNLFRKNKNFFIRNKNIIILIAIIILIIISLIFFSGESNDYLLQKNKKEQKIINFIEKNNSLSIEQIMKNSCIICLDNFKKDAPLSLPCGHNFHKKCLGGWVKILHKCPLCNRDIEFNLKKIIKEAHLEFDDKVKFLNIIETFVDIQKKINPNMIQESFCKKLIEEYKVKFENGPIVIYTSPETIICKSLAMVEEDKKDHYEKLETSTQTQASVVERCNDGEVTV